MISRLVLVPFVAVFVAAVWFARAGLRADARWARTPTVVVGVSGASLAGQFVSPWLWVVPLQVALAGGVACGATDLANRKAREARRAVSGRIAALERELGFEPLVPVWDPPSASLDQPALGTFLHLLDEPEYDLIEQPKKRNPPPGRSGVSSRPQVSVVKYADGSRFVSIDNCTRSEYLYRGAAEDGRAFDVLVPPGGTKLVGPVVPVVDAPDPVAAAVAQPFDPFTCRHEIVSVRKLGQARDSGTCGRCGTWFVEDEARMWMPLGGLGEDPWWVFVNDQEDRRKAGTLHWPGHRLGCESPVLGCESLSLTIRIESCRWCDGGGPGEYATDVTEHEGWMAASAAQDEWRRWRKSAVAR